MSEYIDKDAALDALWKALYEYEDETEKKFQESPDLDLNQWMLHRIFVQNMNDIDRQTILLMPAVEIVRCKDCKHRFVDGENVRFNVCELNHNKVQADDWFCADGERRSENERPD